MPTRIEKVVDVALALRLDSSNNYKQMTNQQLADYSNDLVRCCELAQSQRAAARVGDAWDNNVDVTLNIKMGETPAATNG